MDPIQILRVFDVRFIALKSEVPKVLIEAVGVTASPGWSSAELRPRENDLPRDGILDLDFVAIPPKERVIDSRRGLPVSASLVWENSDGLLIGAKLYSRSNALVRMINEPKRRPGGAVLRFSGGLGDQTAPTDVGIEDITFEDGEDAPTLGEDPTEFLGEDTPTFFEEGEDQPTVFGEGETMPTALEDEPTTMEEPPTFDEQPSNPLVEAGSLPSFEAPSNVLSETPSVPQIENPSTWWENDPGSWPGPFENPPQGFPLTNARQQYRWVIRNGRWQLVRIAKPRSSPFGQW